MNSERRIQRPHRSRAVGRVEARLGDRASVAQAMGKGDLFPYRSADDVWEEIRKVWPAAAGITYDRLDDVGLQWPCPTEDHPGTDILHRDTFAKGRTAPCCGPFRSARPRRRRTRSSLRAHDGSGALSVQRRDDDHAHAELGASPHGSAETSGDDARRLGIHDGAHVRVTSKYGEAVLPAEVTTRVHTGQLFATFSDPATFVNRLTGPQRDPRTHTPQYKVTAVRLEPISRA